MRCALAASLFSASTSGYPDEGIPTKFEGTWEIQPPPGRPRTNGAARIAVIKKNADGTFEGKMDMGGRMCEMNQAPISGHYDGTQLEFTGSLTDRMPNANCWKDIRFVLKRSGSSFEGRAVNINEPVFALRLSPQEN